jgi:hypothetical protein
MLTTEIYLATYCLAAFRLSFFRVGPTELRIILAVGTIALFVDPMTSVLGGRFKLFDAGAVVAIVGIGVALLAGTVAHTVHLYRAEQLPAIERNGA